MEHHKQAVSSLNKSNHAVPHIKISGAKTDPKSRKISGADKPVVPNKTVKDSLVVSYPVRERSRDKGLKKPPQAVDIKNENSQRNDALQTKPETKPKISNTNGTSAMVGDKQEINQKAGKYPMRRAASVDIGGLGRKKKSKKKKIKVDQASLLAQHAASKETLPQGHPQRSGSLGTRPNSLNLKNTTSVPIPSDNAVFPTPVPVKRHSISAASYKERKSSVTANSISPEVSPNDTSAILPPKPKQKQPKWRKADSDTVEFSDPEDGWYSTFPTGEGYRKHGLKYTFPSAPYIKLQSPVIRKRWFRYLIFLLYAIMVFLLFVPVTAIILVLLPVCAFFKAFLVCCCTCCNVQNQGCCMCGQRLSVTERFWLQTEQRSPQVVQSLVIVEFGLSVPQIVNLVNNRLVLAKGEDGSRLYPRFSQRIAQTCSDLIWQEDRSFFIHNHVSAMPRGIESLEDLQDYISDLASRPFVFDRPLWEVQVLTDFGDLRDTVILFRMHPCLEDGVSMVKILYKSIADVEPVTTVPPLLGRVSCMDNIKSIFESPIKLFSKILLPKQDFNLLHGEHIHLSGRKVITWSDPFSLSSAIKIKQVSRSTLNEVFMSVAAGSIRNYLILNDIHHPYDIQTSIPVYYGTNKHDSGVGNDVLFLKVRLPTNTEGAVPRLWQMKAEMDQIRGSSMFAITRRIFKLSYHLLSESLWNKLWIYILRKCSCIVSSLPGPEVSLRMSSKQIKTIFYWFPPVEHVALAISFFTYGDRIQMAVSADRAVLPNPELIAKDFVYQMQTLYEQLGHRRIPGDQPTNRKSDLTLLNTEIRPEETASQLQKKMSLIHQEIQNVRHKMDARKYETSDDDRRLMTRIETLKEQFRELLVEMRKRKAAESELAITFSEEDSTEDDDDYEIPRRPFRRRAMSVSSRLSTSSVSSTVRPLPAPTPLITPDYSPDSPLMLDKQVPYTSYPNERKFHTIPYLSRRPSGNGRHNIENIEILEYQYSPSMERRHKPPA